MIGGSLFQAYLGAYVIVNPLVMSVIGCSTKQPVLSSTTRLHCVVSSVIPDVGHRRVTG